MGTEFLDNKNFYDTYDISKNKSEPILYKYEYVQILCLRAQQISYGSKPLIDLSKHKDLNTPQLIAEEEIRQRKSPFIIKRFINTKIHDLWKLEDLSIDGI
mgnify:CR=1 FL=1|tara:strand:+ start:68 stop:370 length:303 start_codon:yes stop_codon:yes gene_type:complete